MKQRLIRPAGHLRSDSWRNVARPPASGWRLAIILLAGAATGATLIACTDPPDPTGLSFTVVPCTLDEVQEANNRGKEDVLGRPDVAEVRCAIVPAGTPTEAIDAILGRQEMLPALADISRFEVRDWEGDPDDPAIRYRFLIGPLESSRRPRELVTVRYRPATGYLIVKHVWLTPHSPP